MIMDSVWRIGTRTTPDSDRSVHGFHPCDTTCQTRPREPMPTGSDKRKARPIRDLPTKGGGAKAVSEVVKNFGAALQTVARGG